MRKNTLAALLPFILVAAASCAGAGGGSGASKASEEGTSGEVPAGGPAAERVPLSATFPSVEALAEEVLRGIESNNFEALMDLALSKEEYRGYVWPELPASRPGTNLTVDYTWESLYTKSDHALHFTLARHGGEKYTLVRVEFEDDTTDYGSFLVHRDARVVVRNEQGQEGRLDLFGSVMEYQGRFKVFSFVTD